MRALFSWIDFLSKFVRIIVFLGSSVARPQRLASWHRARLAWRAGRVPMFYTYVLKSLRDDKLYIGWTNDLKSRLEEHNMGRVESTKYRRPLDLVYYESCLSKEKAIKREKYFKTGFGRRFLKERI